MTDTPFDPAGVTQRALGDLVRGYGPASLDSSQLVTQVLPDLMAGADREAALVQAAAAAGVGRLLTERIGHGMAASSAVRDIGAMLAQRHAFDRRACDWVVGQYALALGYSLEPETQVRNGPTGDPETTEPTGPTAPVPGPPPPVRPHRTGLIVGASGVVVAAIAIGVAVAVTTGGNHTTGANCLIGNWRSTSMHIDGGTITSGGITITYSVGGTGHGTTDIHETLNGTANAYVSNYTFDYAATESGITYTNVAGSYTVTDATGKKDNETLDSFNDDQYLCSGDTLEIVTPDDGSSQMYARR